MDSIDIKLKLDSKGTGGSSRYYLVVIPFHEHLRSQKGLSHI
jgi:hypothetical protein